MKEFRRQHLLEMNENLKITAMYYSPEESGDKFAVIVEGGELLTVKFEKNLYEEIRDGLFRSIDEELLKSNQIDRNWVKEVLEER